MTTQRQGEIAMLLIRRKIFTESSPSPKEIKRSLGNMAKEIGIETKEMIEFVKPIYEEAFKKGFDGLDIVEKKRN